MKTLVCENNKDYFSFSKGCTLSIHWCELDEYSNEVFFDEVVYTHEEYDPIVIDCVKVWRVKDEEDTPDGLLVYLGKRKL